MGGAAPPVRKLSSPAPPPLPRRTASGNSSLNVPSSDGAPPTLPPRNLSPSPAPSIAEESSYGDYDPERPGLPKKSSVQSLQSVKKFGDVDMSSGKGFYSSIRNGTVNKSRTPAPAAPPVPSAFPARKNTWGPPPKRSASTHSDDSASVSTGGAPPPLPGRKTAEPEPEPEPEGEWAEALYAYNSGEAGDLAVSEGERVLVTDRTSDDWWTAEVDGKHGLVPASYLKLL
jgi:abl interactor 2